MQKFWMFFYGLPNIIGLSLLIFGLLAQLVLMSLGMQGAFFVGVGLVFNFFVYLAGWLIGWWLQDNNANLAFQQTLTAEEIERELQQLLKKIDGRVPVKAYKKVQNIQQSVLNVLPALVQNNGSSEDLFMVKKTVFDYLPTTLENYLKLPAVYAKLHPVSQGKTAKVMLVEQLSIIDESLIDITHNIHNNDVQALLANQNFLQQRLENTQSFL